MNRPAAACLFALTLLSGCAGTRTPKLAKCVGPFRYANPYGTVLPSLPISGQPLPEPAAAHPPAPAPVPASPATPAVSPPADPPAPAKSSALLPHYPSC